MTKGHKTIRRAATRRMAQGLAHGTVREGPDVVEISDEYMIATIDGQVMATARWSWYAAADGNGAWIASTHPKRLLSWDKALSAMVLAWLLASARTDEDPHVISLREELKW